MLAKISYSYFYQNQTRAKKNDDDGGFRYKAVLREVFKHYVGEDQQYESALKSLRDCIQFRKVSHHSRN